MYLRIAPDLVPKHDDDLTRPSIRHPDLQPNNVFVSQDLEITGLIDWQHYAVLPLFLQAGIPSSLQNYGDAVSESLEDPRLPADFDEQDEAEQLKQVLVLRKRQLRQGDHAPLSLPRQGARRLSLHPAAKTLSPRKRTLGRRRRGAKDRLG
jgi:hypothetical protein